MSSTSFDATIDLRPRPATGAVRGLLAFYVLAAGLLLAAEPPQTLGLVLSCGLLLSWFGLRRHPALGFGPRALTRLIWHGGSARWSLESGLGTGTRIEATLAPSTLVTRHLLLLNFRFADGRRRSRALFGSDVDPDSFRRLQARLRNTRAGTDAAR